MALIVAEAPAIVKPQTARTSEEDEHSEKMFRPHPHSRRTVIRWSGGAIKSESNFLRHLIGQPW